VLIGTLSLSACQTPSVITEHSTITLTEPLIYQHCQEEPSEPPVGASNKAWKDYLLDLKAYGNDCEAKVNGGREWARRHGQQSADQLPNQSKPETEPAQE
jgi:hypothetical protein